MNTSWREEDAELLHSFGLVFSNWPSTTSTKLFWRAAPDYVRPADLLADLDVLQHCVLHAYIGCETAEVRGWDWGRFFNQWAEDLGKEQEAVLGIRKAFEPWQQLMGFQLDNHSGPRSPLFSPVLSTTAVHLTPNNRSDSPPPGAWQAWLAEAECLRRVWATSYPSSRAPREQQLFEWSTPASQRPNRTQSLRLLGVHSEDELCYAQLSPEVCYLRIPTLTIRVETAARLVQQSLPEDAFQKRSVVIDLRGNRGGMALTVFEILNQLPGWTELDHQSLFSFQSKASATVDTLQWGAVQLQLEHAPRPLPPATLQRFQTVLTNACLPVVGPPKLRAFPSGTSAHDHRFPWQPKPSHPRLVILTDSDCASDGEFLAYALSLIPGSVLVGSSTGGVAQFGRPGCFVLPKTGIPFRLASTVIDLFGDGRPFDGLGLHPDVLLHPDKPLSPVALLTLIEQIDQLSSA